MTNQLKPKRFFQERLKAPPGGARGAAPSAAQVAQQERAARGSNRTKCKSAMKSAETRESSAGAKMRYHQRLVLAPYPDTASRSNMRICIQVAFSTRLSAAKVRQVSCTLEVFSPLLRGVSAPCGEDIFTYNED